MTGCDDFNLEPLGFVKCAGVLRAGHLCESGTGMGRARRVWARLRPITLFAFIGRVFFGSAQLPLSRPPGVLRGVLRQKFVDHVFGSTCQNAAVKQTTKLFVGIVRADRRANQLRA